MKVTIANGHLWLLPNIEVLCARLTHSLYEPPAAALSPTKSQTTLMDLLRSDFDALAIWLEKLPQQLQVLAQRGGQVSDPADADLAAANASLAASVEELIDLHGRWTRQAFAAADAPARILMMAVIRRLMRTLLQCLMRYAEAIKQPESLRSSVKHQDEFNATYTLEAAFEVGPECMALSRWLATRNTLPLNPVVEAPVLRRHEPAPRIDHIGGGWALLLAILIASVTIIVFILHPLWLFWGGLGLFAFWLLVLIVRDPLLALVVLFGISLGN